MHFNIKIKLPDNPLPANAFPLHTKLYVSKELLCVPKRHISIIVHETVKTLVNQEFQCFKCAKAHIKLSPLSVDCQGTNHLSGDLPDQIQMDLVVHCGAGGTAVHFSLSISPTSTTHYRKSVQSAPGVLTKKQKNLSTVTPATLKRNLASINARFRKALNSRSAYELWDFELNSCCTWFDDSLTNRKLFSKSRGLSIPLCAKKLDHSSPHLQVFGLYYIVDTYT